MARFYFRPNKRTRDTFGRFAKIADQAVPLAAAGGVTYGAARLLNAGKKKQPGKKRNKLKTALKGYAIGGLAGATYLGGRSAIKRSGRALRNKRLAREHAYRAAKNAELPQLPPGRRLRKIKAISIK